MGQHRDRLGPAPREQCSLAAVDWHQLTAALSQCSLDWDLLPFHPVPLENNYCFGDGVLYLYSRVFAVNVIPKCSIVYVNVDKIKKLRQKKKKPRKKKKKKKKKKS